MDQSRRDGFVPPPGDRVPGSERSLRDGDWIGLDGPLAASGDGPVRQSVEVVRHYKCRLVIGCGVLDDWAGEMEAPLANAAAAWVVADRTAWEYYGHRFLAAPRAADLVRGVLTLDVAKGTKSVATWEQVIEWLSGHRVGRRDVVIPFGGATLSDVVGLAAATYMRGIAYLNVATTLVAQADGAIGGKVAIDTPRARNLVGSFYHPVGILSDPTVLVTLPQREIACGLAEAIKTVTVHSEEVFAFLEPRIRGCLCADAGTLDTVVRLCASIKMQLLRPDPFEQDLRRVLNFGHTLAHPIETVFGYDAVRHGEAVAVGMATATRIGVIRGLTSRRAADRLTAAILQAGLPIGVSKTAVPEILEQLDVVRSIRAGSLRYVIPCDIGRMAILDDVSLEEIATALPATPGL